MGPPILRFIAIPLAIVGVILGIIFTVFYAREKHDLQVRLIAQLDHLKFHAKPFSKTEFAWV